MPCRRRFRSIRSLAPFALLAVLAGCDPGPGPFAHPPGKAPTVIGMVPDAGGIIVRDIAGPPETVAGALRNAMIDALAQQDIPAATSGGNRRSRFLQGLVTASPRGTTTVRLQIAWALTDTAGKAAGSKTVTQDVPRRAWEQADPATIKALAGTSAAAVAAMIQEPTPADAGARHRMPLYVYPVAGLPEIDAIALRRAMELALRERDYDVKAELADNALVIAGNVVLGKVEAGQQPIEISWAVLDSSGKELGRLAQNNTLKVGEGQPSLAALANDIADAAAGGVVEVMDNLPAPDEKANGAGNGAKVAPAK